MSTLRIQTCKGFVVRKQKLVYGGQELARNDSRVRDYGVGDENVLHLVLRPLDDQWFIDDICGINDAVIHLLVQKSAKVRAKPVDKNFEFSFDAQYSSGSSDNEDESNDNKSVRCTEQHENSLTKIYFKNSAFII
ncbi:hypothetical protein IFM89_019182 [Coptis chinensis]|uniref:Ubiquitin-like domain-containing protein n=1 Tax=Coptis chinensis TaxID=261450 RepID=A0A835LE50_9MAGN|nr:hypothetical protein IFM89_019182 [Coptis chinensis]